MPSMKYLYIWGCPTHVLIGKSKEGFILLGIQRELGLSCFIVLETARCLSVQTTCLGGRLFEQLQVKKNMLVLEEISYTRMGQSPNMPRDEVVVLDTLQVTTYETLSTIIPHYGARIIRVPYRFMF